MAAHRYWRLYITAVTGFPHLDLTELILRTTAGGAQAATGGTAIYSNQTGGFEADKAFDALDGTCWYVSQSSFPVPQWLGYDFGAGNPKDIVQYALKCWNASETPQDFRLQWSEDNTTWTDADTRSNQTAWTANEVRAFDVAPQPTTATTTQAQHAAAAAAIGGAGALPDALALDVVYLGQIFTDLDGASSSDNTTLDVVYLAEPIGTRGTGPITTDSTVTTRQAQTTSASVTGTAAAHRYWRVYITAATGPDYLDIAEIEFRASIGGADQCVGGTAIYSAQTAGLEAYKAFNDNSGDPWYINQGTYPLPQWIGYDFGAGNDKEVAELAIMCWITSEAPRDFKLQYSDDGSTWTTKFTRVGETWASSRQVKAFSSSNETVASTSQAQSASGSAALSVSATVATTQGQHTGAGGTAAFAVQGATSQTQTSSAQAAVVTPWQLVSSAHIDSRDGSDTFAPFALAAGDHVVVSVWLTGYTNPVDGSPDTSTSRAWTLSVSDTAGNTYVGLTPVRDQVVIGYPQFPVKWQYQFYCVNAIGSASNVLTVAPVSPPPNPYDASHPTMFSTVTVLNSGGVAAEFNATAAAASTSNGAGSLSLPAMTVQPGASVLYNSASNGSTTESAPGWTLTDQFFSTVFAYWRANNSTGTQNTTVTGDGGIRLLSAVSLRNAQGTVGTTRQAQSSSASVEISIDFVTSSTTTKQGQSSAALGAVGIDAAIGTAQGQRAAATASATLVAMTATSQGQSSNALAAVFQPGSTATTQAQSTSGLANVASTASAALSQAQQAAADAGVSLDANSASAQVQGSAGQLRLSLDATISSASIQRTSAAAAAAYVLDAATAQAQEADAQAGVGSPVQAATAQGQGTSAVAGVSLDASAATDQGQRVRAQARAEAVNTVESGQAQVVGGMLGLSSDAPTATRQGQTSALQAGVAADSQIQLGQSQHIGDGNLLVVSVDAIVTTAQARQSARGALVQYVPKPGSLSLATHRMHPVLAGTTELQTALDAPTRVRPVLSGRADLRPD